MVLASVSEVIVCFRALYGSRSPSSERRTATCNEATSALRGHRVRDCKKCSRPHFQFSIFNLRRHQWCGPTLNLERPSVRMTILMSSLKYSPPRIVYKREDREKSARSIYRRMNAGESRKTSTPHPSPIILGPESIPSYLPVPMSLVQQQKCHHHLVFVSLKSTPNVTEQDMEL
jgi:hypothetical protein